MTLHMKLKAAGAASALVAALASAACSPQGEGNALAQVGSRRLDAAEVRAAVPSGLSGADSLAFVKAYVDAWVADELLVREAERLLPNLEQIERQVADYRRNLLLWAYRSAAVSADTTLAVTEADIDSFYTARSAELRLEEPMVRGIYIKLESTAAVLPEVRQLYRSERQADIERLEKAGLREAIHYDYFRDQWVPLHRISTKIPCPIPAGELRSGYRLDFEADGFTYLLSVSDVLPAGSPMPREAAGERIRQTLEALRQRQLDALLLERLRAEAQARGDLTLSPLP